MFRSEVKKELTACTISVELPSSHELRKEIEKSKDQLISILDEFLDK